MLAIVLLFPLCSVRGEIVHQLMGAGSFVAALLVLASPLFVLRKIAQCFCREWWKTRYVRLSVDVACAGLFILFLATFLPLTSCGHLPDYMVSQIMPKWQEVGGWYLSDSIGRLVILSNVSWFLENFPLYVILPGGLVLFGGYSLERARQAKKPASS